MVLFKTNKISDLQHNSMIELEGILLTSCGNTEFSILADISDCKKICSFTNISRSVVDSRLLCAHMNISSCDIHLLAELF